MGGCKCSFFACGNNTTVAKETKSIHSHFFHFPVRDLKRCVEWAIYANRMEFLNLSLDKLKNKVICDYHFSENHFMNYTRSKLNKTSAIPTIYINEAKEEIDLLESPTDWVILNKSQDIPMLFKNMPITKIDMDESAAATTAVSEQQQQQQPAVKRIKIESSAMNAAASVSSATPQTTQQKMRLLNKTAAGLTPLSSTINNKIITLKQVKADATQVNRPPPTKPLSSSKLPTTRIQKISGTPSSYQVRVEKSKSNESRVSKSPEFSFADNDGNDQETFEFVTVMQHSGEEQIAYKHMPSSSNNNNSAATTAVVTTSATTSSGIPKEIKDLITKTSEDMNELKTLVKSSITKMQTPSKKVEEPSSVISSSLNKVQLFNGIKRYLPPSLMTLLRMELFGGPNREYRPDEKIICGELLKLGEETYDFFNDEWRLRLPDRNVVQTWLSEENQIDDDDAS